MSECVFYELNKDYEDACLVSVKSFLNHNDLDIYVYCINFIDYDFKNRIESLSKRIHVVFYNVSTQLKCMGCFNEIIDVISAKFYIFNGLLEKYDSVLYIDGDVLIRKNISDLFAYTDGIYGCNDCTEYSYLTDSRKTFFRRFKSNTQTYINAGFLLVNNYKFDLEHYKDVIRKYGFRYPEQDYLNLLPHNVIDLKYCGNHYCGNADIDFYTFHYFGNRKPFFCMEEVNDITKHIRYIDEYFNVAKSISSLLTTKFVSNVEKNFRLQSS